MKFSEVSRRLTGISCPLFGVSWNPGEAKVANARRVLTYLEDRRVLYAPWDVEVPAHCVESVLDIRRVLTAELGQLDDKEDDIAPHLRAMRAACRQFLATTSHLRDDVGGMHSWMGGYDGWRFNDALGEMRAVFGIHIAQLSVKFGIDVEDQLAVILPPEIEDSDGLDDEPQRFRPGRR